MLEVPFEIINNSNSLELLGKGLQYPFAITSDPNLDYQRAKQQKYFQKVFGNIANTLGTVYGERPMNREFGCKIHSLKFEPNDEIFARLGTYFIADALFRWVKTIELKRVLYSTTLNELDNNMRIISLDFTFIKYQVDGNYVFPFYQGTPKVR